MSMTDAFEALKSSMEGALLTFPITDFDDHDRFDARRYMERIQWLASHGGRAVFAATAAGEFFSLDRLEYAAVVGAAVQAHRNGPVFAAVGLGTRFACECAAEAQRLGASGLLVLPPYLINAPQEGLVAHMEAICRAAPGLAVIVYNRANGVLDAASLVRLAEQCPNFIGLKDGVGDLPAFLEIQSALGDRLCYINGMPTAELFAQAYHGVGVDTYSSAILNFVPEVAVACHAAIVQEDAAWMARFHKEFLLPYSRLRASRPGYAVSLIKGGASLIGRPAGPVRPPLVDPSPEELEKLQGLIASARALGRPSVPQAPAGTL